jgi:hypothetical protein
MLRQTELLLVLGRRLTERLVRAGWIVPVTSTPGAIFFNRHDVHLALKQLAREGWMLNGHTRSASIPPRPKVQKLSLEETLAGVEPESLFYE